jgi:hypothetical protein
MLGLKMVLRYSSGEERTIGIGGVAVADPSASGCATIPAAAAKTESLPGDDTACLTHRKITA